MRIGPRFCGVLVALLSAVVSLPSAATGADKGKKMTEQEAIKAITDAGGKVKKDTPPEHPTTDVELSPENDEQLQALIPALQAIPKLYRLGLINTNITDKGVAMLKDVHVKVLNLDYCTKLTDEVINSIKAMKDLTAVSLLQASVSEKATKALKKARPDMSVISS